MALVTGYIKNAAGAAVPNASVTVLDGYFESTGEGTAAMYNGFFGINIDPGNEPYALQFSSIGYKPLAVPLANWQNGKTITLQQSFVTGEEVVVYATPKQKQPFPLWLLAFPLIAYAVNDKKRGKVSGINATKWFNDLPPWAKGAITVGGGFVAYNVLNKILKKRPEGNEPKDASDEVIDLGNQGITPTYTDAQFESFCNSIVQAIWDCGTDEAAIYNVMRAMRNNADIYKLISVYGVRAYKGCFEGWFTLVERSLSGALSSELSAAEKAKVNSILRGNGITFQFA